MVVETCFWAHDSIVGLTRDCPVVPAAGGWDFVEIDPAVWTPRPFGPSGNVGFPLADVDASITTATLTGVAPARWVAEPSGDSGALITAATAATSVTYTTVSIATTIAELYPYPEIWCMAVSGTYSASIGGAYSIFACRWDTDKGVKYTLSMHSPGI